MNFDELRQQLLELLMSNQIDDATYDRRLNLLEQQAAKQRSVLDVNEARIRSQQGYQASLVNQDVDDTPTTPFVIGSGYRVGKYKLLETRGEGGMGIVWKAVDTELDDMEVAIKILPPAIQRQSGDLERFKKTFQIVKRLHHDHICPLYDMGYQNHPDIGWFQVMRLIDGRTLTDYRDAYVSEHGDFPLSEVVRLLEPVARALDYAHAQKIAHRDIKPENIFVEGTDLEVRHVWLIDFGIAAVIRGTMTQAASPTADAADTAGSRPYMAPELLQAGQPGPLSDQYALGVVAYELLAGYPPFSSDDFSVLRHAVIHDPMPEIDDQPAAVNAILTRALHKDRKQRFASCAEFITALAQSFNCAPLQKAFSAAPTTAPAAILQTERAQEFPLPGTAERGALSEGFISVGLRAGDRTVFMLDGIKYAFRWCPAGKFTMGSPKNEKDRGSDEDQVSVELSTGFWMQETTVTQAMWYSVMGTQPWQWNEYVKEGAEVAATYVDWLSAKEFAEKLQAAARQAKVLSEKGKIILPTEARWEYACRAGTATAFSFGPNARQLGEYAWFDRNVNSKGGAYAHEVGLKRLNLWGIFDMHGNVCEWCLDCKQRPLPGGCDPIVTTGSSRVVRGGSWSYGARFARCSHRLSLSPTTRGSYVGFRVVVES